LNIQPPDPEPEALTFSMWFSSARYMEFPQEKSDNSPVENQIGNPVIFLEGALCYKIDYSTVVRKSRCVAGIGYIARNINSL
jgi:hypothetical protein